MTYDPEKSYIKNLEHVLKELKSLELHAADGDPLEFKISTVIGGGYPTGKEERSLLRKLRQMEVISLHEKQWFDDNFEKAPRYLLNLNNQKFNEIYTTLDNPFNVDETIIKTLNKNYIQKNEFEYDVVFSLAGENKEYVGKVADYIKKKGLNVWFYGFEEVELWGKNQIDTFSEIFTKSARYCVLFISKEYTQKVWPNLERQFIQSRWLKDPNYLLPARFDDSLVVGIPDTVGYISLKNVSPEKFGDQIIAKVKSISSVVHKTPPQYKIPKLKQSFNVYQEKDKWIEYIVNELKDRISNISGMDVYSSQDSDTNKIRILLNGETVYSLNIYKNYIGGEKGFSFYGTFGEIPLTNNKSYNAWGSFLWSKEKDDVVIDFISASMLPTIGEEKKYTKEEFVNALWQYLADHLEENY